MYMRSRCLPMIMTSSIMTACSGGCRKSIGNGVNIYVHFSSTPTSILNLAISSESQHIHWRFQRYIVHMEILSTFHAQVEYISGENTLFRLLRYNLALRISLLLWVTKPNIGQTWCTFLYISSQPPFRFWTWICRQKAKKTDVSNDILSIWKYSQLFVHESNLFLLKQLYQANRFTDAAQRWRHGLFIDCTQTDRWTDTQIKHDLYQFHSVHLADINIYSTAATPTIAIILLTFDAILMTSTI